MLRILLADDEPSIRLTISDALRAQGHEVDTAADGAQALSLLATKAFDVIVSDIRMPKVDGMTVFRRAKSQDATVDVILITAHGDVADAVAALKEGAHDYLLKPFDMDEIVLRIQRLDERRGMQRELQDARTALSNPRGPTPIVGQSPQVQRLHSLVETIARSEAPVVITGESGTGKELVARALHFGSSRTAGAFVAVNCAAFPETLIEAELFGHEKGAFTGAMRRRDGRFKAAHGGTLFLDEIGEIPLMVQAKLLRVLQDGIIEPLGTNNGVAVDVRLLCATHRNLRQLIEAGKFREDLYYRINVLDIHVPPLRERRGDLPILVEHFVRRFSKAGASPLSIAPRAWAALAEYPFPGNIRELEHAIQRAMAMVGDAEEIELAHLPTDIAGVAAHSEGDKGGGFRALAVALKEFEREYLLRALSLANGKKTRAAEILGISRKNLWEKLRGHTITDSDVEE